MDEDHENGKSSQGTTQDDDGGDCQDGGRAGNARGCADTILWKAGGNTQGRKVITTDREVEEAYEELQLPTREGRRRARGLA